jgi:hypothetical protein
VIENRDQIRPKSPQAPNPQDPQNLLSGLHDYSAISNSYSRLDYHQSRGTSPGYDNPLLLRDAHTTIQYHLDHLEWLTINRRQILESGLRLASQLSESVEDPVHVVGDMTVEEQIRTPSFELLAWMLKGTFSYYLSSTNRTG